MSVEIPIEKCYTCEYIKNYIERNKGAIEIFKEIEETTGKWPYKCESCNFKRFPNAKCVECSKCGQLIMSYEGTEQLCSMCYGNEIDEIMLNPNAIEYRFIPNFRDYLISQDGRIKSPYSGDIMTGKIDKDGYLTVTLTKDGKKYTRRVHRLLAEAWIPNPDNKPRAAFKDLDKTHISVDNIYWATQKEIVANTFNLEHRSIEFVKELGYKKRKLTREQVAKIKDLRKQGLAQTKLGRLFGVSPRTISSLILGQLYKNLN